MTKSYTQVTADINRGIAKMREGAPDAMAGFSALAKGAMQPGALSAEHKELIARAMHAFDEFQAEAEAHTATSTA